MTSEVKVGDIFESRLQTLVNTVNCVGVMGKGIALHFKMRFPDMFRDYEKRCARHEVKLGEPYLFRTLIPPWILNFPTKDHWRSVSRLADIVAGLNYLESHYKSWGIASLAVPPLGCGEGGLEWRVVGPTLYRHLSRFEIPTELFAPWGTPSEQLTQDFLSDPAAAAARNAHRPSRIDPAWVALAEVVRRVDRETYHWPIGRVSFQKLAFFATEAGLPTGLKFERASYGPFSRDVKPLLTTLVNNGVLVEKPLGRLLSLVPGPTFEDSKATLSNQLTLWEPAIAKLTDLFLRMNTNDAEIAATVLFVARELEGGAEPPTESEVLREFLDWKIRRKPPISAEVAADAIRNLEMLDWVNLRVSPGLPVSNDVLVEAYG